MRKQGIAVFALSAMLVLGTATITSFAAEGWQQSGTSWIYVDTNGNKITNEWRKGADNLWRYLDNQGVMAVNTWADEEYYVDNNGIMVTNKWMKLPIKNPGWNEEGTMVWYYFANSGKAVTDGWSKIDGKYYYFDEEGVMQTGWVDDNTYYLGDDGAMRTGWIFLRDPDEDEDSFNDVVPFEDDEDCHWYYFLSSGKKYVPNISSGDYKLYKIDGAYYCFDGDGAMQTGWVNMGDKEDGNFENFRFFQDNGRVQTGWYTTTPPEDDDFNMDLGGDVEWYYFSSNGTPKVGPPVEEASTDDLVKINGITYLFNEKGNPVYGLRKLQIGKGDDYACYFFGADKATSSVVKGKGTVEEGDGTKSQFYFTESGNKAGRGYSGVKDNYLYYMGKLQKAESGTKYEAINIDGKVYLVNTSGKVVKSGTVKDSSGTKYKTSSTGQITQVDEVSDNGKSLARDPVEPDYWED